jgi:hypothetical protein
MTRFVLSGNGHRIHTGKISKKNYDRLEQESETSDDGSVDIWDYIDFNIAYGVNPEHFQVFIDNVVVASNLDELAVKFKLITHPNENLPREIDKNQNLILVEHEKGEWAELKIDNFNIDLLSFELNTFTLTNNITYQIITSHYNNEFIEEIDDLNPKGVTHYFARK